jgi:hypothetical protein
MSESVRDPSPEEIDGAFSDIIDGRNVKRSRHNLQWGTRDYTVAFVRALQLHGYSPVIVRDIHVAPGERVPAFCIDNATAFFGWVFWEKFSPVRMRKLFGSVIRNEKGDWAVQIPEHRDTIIYANRTLIGVMDIDHPSGF